MVMIIAICFYSMLCFSITYVNYSREFLGIVIEIYSIYFLLLKINILLGY